jgi:parallel beta-helix repeat protein
MNRKVAAIWLSLSILFCVFIIVIEIAPKVTAYIPHDPIRINNNAEFATLAGLEGWIGDGSLGNPYIIEGYDINGSGYGYCIYIGNTTVYFEVKDCYLHDASGGVVFPYFFPDAGIVLYKVQNGTIANNTASSNSLRGIFLKSSSNNIVINNTASSNKVVGISLSTCSNNLVVNNTLLSNEIEGIYLHYSNSNSILNNNISLNERFGIEFYDASSNIIKNNEMIDDGIIISGKMLEHWNTHIIDTTNTVNGKPVVYWKNQTGGAVPLGAGQIILANCTNVSIKNHNVSDGSVGIQLGFSNNNTIANSTVSNNFFGIYLSNSGDNIINNDTVTNNIYGINLGHSSGNTITNTNATNKFEGIGLSHSNNDIIANNSVSNNWNGIYLHYSNSNTISNNKVSNNWRGISSGSSSGNIIANNNASNNQYGISLSWATSNTINNNNLINNGIFIDGYKLEYWNTHTIDTSNTVNGKPVHYLYNQSGGTVPLGAGQVILANCTNMVIENQNVSKGTVGIELGFSNNNTITNNTASVNAYGIYFYSSNNNTITNNIASVNDNGIELDSSNNNKIYYNNIIGNINQADDDTNNGNQWDNGYPSGGNYWSDYIGDDIYSGPNQDILGSDRIGDKNYSIDSDSVDNYPLMLPIGPFVFLYKGWNLISLPYIQSDTNLESVLSSINGSYDAIQWYNISDTSDPWKHNYISKPPNLNDFQEINHTLGFWIHITDPGGVLFEYSGTQPTSNQTISLYPGWNMVGYPSLTSYNITMGLNKINFTTEVDAIWTCDALTQKWEHLDEFDYFKPGKGYYIHSKAQTTWEVPL